MVMLTTAIADKSVAIPYEEECNHYMSYIMNMHTWRTSRSRDIVYMLLLAPTFPTSTTDYLSNK